MATPSNCGEALRALVHQAVSERMWWPPFNQKAELREREREVEREQWVFDRVSVVCGESNHVVWASSVCDGGT